LGLTDFETYHTILNVNFSDNKFYFDDDKEIAIPEGLYELHAIISNAQLCKMNLSRDVENDDEEYPIFVSSTLKIGAGCGRCTGLRERTWRKCGVTSRIVAQSMIFFTCGGSSGMSPT